MRPSLNRPLPIFAAETQTFVRCTINTVRLKSFSLQAAVVLCNRSLNNVSLYIKLLRIYYSKI